MWFRWNVLEYGPQKGNHVGENKWNSRLETHYNSTRISCEKKTNALKLDMVASLVKYPHCAKSTPFQSPTFCQHKPKIWKFWNNCVINIFINFLYRMYHFRQTFCQCFSFLTLIVEVWERLKDIWKIGGPNKLFSYLIRK